jgi:Baseplate J-like protein
VPIRPPALDDRSFDDLVAEVLARIPAHTPEWTHPRVGDPGRTLIELFAWLTDALLYRVNLIPERQRLAFLRLLGVPMRPARAARGIVTVSLDDEEAVDAAELRTRARIDGPVPFETRAEMTVLPVTGAAYAKRPLDDDEQTRFASVVPELAVLYGLGATPRAYVTTQVFPEGAPSRDGFDLVGDTIDGSLWVALLAGTAEIVPQVRAAVGGTGGRQRILNVGLVPRLAIPALFEEIGARARVPHVWEVSTGREVDGEPEYLTLDVVADGTHDLTEAGVVRLILPGEDDLGAPSNDVRQALNAGVGDRPPRLDDEEVSARLVAWLRLRPTVEVASLSLSWAGINAIDIDQRVTIEGRILGTSDGSADQPFQLPVPQGASVEPDTLELIVDDPLTGSRAWRRADDLATAGRDAEVYRLDAEAGVVQFGDGVRGRVPSAGARVRVGRMRAGGGVEGNVPAGTLDAVTAFDLSGAPVNGLKAFQPLPLEGGARAETLEEAERRIPDLFRHRNRAVTADDFRTLAAETPGVRVGRVEVMPRFKPHERRFDVPGIVSVMALPLKEQRQAPNPRPDRPFIEAVHAQLDRRRLIGTELYVIGCEYVPLGLGVGIELADGAERDTVSNAVREALRRFLWSLAPGGPRAEGWPLGGAVRDRDLEVVVAQVAGVRAVPGINLFRASDNGRWDRIAPASSAVAATLTLEPWQLPELLGIVIGVPDVPTDLRGVPNPFLDGDAVAVPVVPEVC